MLYLSLLTNLRCNQKHSHFPLHLHHRAIMDTTAAIRDEHFQFISRTHRKLNRRKRIASESLASTAHAPTKELHFQHKTGINSTVNINVGSCSYITRWRSSCNLRSLVFCVNFPACCTTRITYGRKCIKGIIDSTSTVVKTAPRTLAKPARGLWTR